MKIEKSISLAVDNAVKEGLTDIFPRPFEMSYLQSLKFREILLDTVKTRIRSGSLSGLKVHPISHVLFPKKDVFDFRRAALIQPVDTVTFLALTLLYADIIEKNRIPKRRNVIFSYRLKPQKGYLFDPKYNFTAFNSHVAHKIASKRTKVLVKCDISSFYDRLNLHRLESTLLSLPIDNKSVKLTNELLLFWANRDSYGLPVGSNASRILAEAALIPVDNYLTSMNIKYCRFVDDFRFFAPNAKVAHNWLSLLVERLYLEGLTINPSKTVIEDVTQLKKGKKEEKVESKQSKKNQPRLLVGYTGTIPTKFRELSAKERGSLQAEDADQFENQIRDSQILQPVDVRKFLKIVVAQNDFKRLAIFQDISEKFPQFIPFLVDVLIKKESNIPDTLRTNIITFYSHFLIEGNKHPEYILVAVVKLLGSKGFQNKEALMNFFRNLKRNAGAYIGRAVLDALEICVNRTDVLEIRQYYTRADLWEKRAIIRIVSTVLSEEEKRPWLKNVRLHIGDDIFAAECAKK